MVARAARHAEWPVDLSLVQNIRAELKEVTLTPSTNPFFQAHHLATFGDLRTSLKA
ncbi:hypothetical protein FOMPIDRAFT_1052299 [Fomitopsis schrenkii]|uniref:Uncharacterized protein n=1 Tax=Fomitopsis schrenkii TaxID=2126942 RepID=S8F797_FOMSC|nr:hypothetical protein FOMPIDRAFT_1052299 [Fomitopsis schrenkii]